MLLARARSKVKEFKKRRKKHRPKVVARRVTAGKAEAYRKGGQGPNFLCYETGALAKTACFWKRTSPSRCVAIDEWWLIRLRTRCWWPGYKAASAGLILALYRTKCVACGEMCVDDAEHLFTECEDYRKERRFELRVCLSELERWVRGSGLSAGAHELSKAKIHKPILLGGEVNALAPGPLWSGENTRNGGWSGAVTKYLTRVIPRHVRAVWSKRIANISPRAEARNG